METFIYGSKYTHKYVNKDSMHVSDCDSSMPENTYWQNGAFVVSFAHKFTYFDLHNAS